GHAPRREFRTGLHELGRQNPCRFLEVRGARLVRGGSAHPYAQNEAHGIVLLGPRRERGPPALPLGNASGHVASSEDIPSLAHLKRVGVAEEGLFERGKERRRWLGQRRSPHGEKFARAW